jgi:signal transduction histidine kinase
MSAAVDSVRTAPPSARERVNILLVDDQPARLLSYETILADLDQSLVQARSGLEALEKLMCDEFAVVLLDVSMPGMDGFETAAMIHDHPRFERTPIIFVTGVHISELDRLKGYKVGAVDYVSIPLVPEILRSKVSVLVELHCQRRELQRLNDSLAQANARLELAHSTLQAEKTDELERLNGTLRIANQELATANRSLQAEITERQRAEAALKEADRHKDEFLAILAHELRNPLAPIRTAVDIMGRLPLATPQLVWSREVVERQVVHLTRLVDDLLDVSRITRGVINLSREPVNVQTVIMRAVETLQPAISQHGHELVLEVSDQPLQVMGDLTRLTQMVGNLLSNAAKYTNPRGRIVLSVEPCDAGVRISVSDNGIGIAPEAVPRLFTLFSQLPVESARMQGGLGIGLALVQRLAGMHGGHVEAHSDGPDRGSTFTVILPVIHAEAKMTPPVDTSVEMTGSRRRILVADDNIDALDSLAMLLEFAGHEVHKARDGAEALAEAREWHPEIMLLDLGMPKLTGYEVAQRVRAEDWGRPMKLVAISGWGQSEDQRRSRESGFDQHLVKPISFESLNGILCAPNA